MLDIEIRPSSLVFHNGFTVMAVQTEVDGFWLQLGSEAGFAFFKRQSPEEFLLQQVLSVPNPGPYPKASLRGVLWSRRAAIEADQCIAAFEAAEHRMQEPTAESEPGSRHEA